MTQIKILQKLFEARDAIHFMHLNTTSYAKHKALGEFYDSWLDLVDSFIETYQGKYGRITGVISIDVNSASDTHAYLVDLMKFLNVDIVTIIDQKIDSDLDNIIADMKALINHTMYLLTLS